MPTIREIVIDCNDADSLATFWAGALGFELQGAAGSYRALKDPYGGPKLILQEVEEPKAVKNRVHFDLEAVDIRAEARRIEALGAVLLIVHPVATMLIEVSPIMLTPQALFPGVIWHLLLPTVLLIQIGLYYGQQC